MEGEKKESRYIHTREREWRVRNCEKNREQVIYLALLWLTCLGLRVI